MIGLVQRSVERHPDQPAVVGEFRTLTYGQLLADARTVAAHLRTRGAVRVAIAEDDPIGCIVLLIGCAHAGVEACVLPRAATDEMVLSLAERIGESTIVTSRELDAPNAVATSEMFADVDPAAVGEPAEDGTVLVLTTGTSSGNSRAARHLWSRVTGPIQGARPTNDQRWMLCYGLNQFGGLQVLLHVFASGSTVYVPDSFQPRHAAQLLSQWSITHASGTPTFWRFVLLEMGKSDLPPLAQITLGGEAVPAPVLAGLRDRFPDANISQIYGATEYGSNITVKDGLPGLPLEILKAHDRLQFEVRDGELWVKATTAMLGYRDAESGEAEQDLDTAEWRPTGDLVEIVGDRVQFRGRKSEVINVGGVKVHPIPIEERISTVDGVVVSRVKGRANAVVGTIVAAEVVVAEGYDPDAVVAAIRAACEDLPPAARPRSIKVVDELRITGNKIARGAS